LASLSGNRPAVLFVCMGNICRSPLAEGLCHAHLTRRNALDRVRVDSAGTIDAQVGRPADPRAKEAASAMGVTLDSIARRIDPQTDWSEFTHIVPMDDDNIADLLNEHAPADRVRLLTSYLPTDHRWHARPVPDPYRLEADAFELARDMIDASMPHLLDDVLSEARAEPSP